MRSVSGLPKILVDPVSEAEWHQEHSQPSPLCGLCPGRRVAPQRETEALSPVGIV